MGRGANVNGTTTLGETPLHLAAKASQADTVRTLLDGGAQVDAESEVRIWKPFVLVDVIWNLINSAYIFVSELCRLTERWNQRICSLIFQSVFNVSDVTVIQQTRQTALHIAAYLGDVDTVQTLLQKHAHVDALTSDLYTPLHMAARNDRYEVAKILLECDASQKLPTKVSNGKDCKD